MRSVRRRGRDGGATLVETAVVLPIILLLLFGVFEFGRFIVTGALVHNASREAARYAVGTGPGSGVGPRYADCDGMRGASQRFTVFGVPNDSQVALAFDEGPGTTAFLVCSGSSVDPSAIESGDRIAATVSVPFQTVVPLLSEFLGPTTISVTTSRTIKK